MLVVHVARHVHLAACGQLLEITDNIIFFHPGYPDTIYSWRIKACSLKRVKPTEIPQLSLCMLLLAIILSQTQNKLKPGCKQCHITVQQEGNSLYTGTHSSAILNWQRVDCFLRSVGVGECL